MVSVDTVEVDKSKQNTTDAAVHVDAMTVKDSGSIHASWDIEDPETEITEIHWAIGTVRGGTQLQPYYSIGPASEARAEVRLTHGSDVHVSVLAVNGAGLRRLFYSSPTTIDLTPPQFHFVHDGNSPGGHTDLQESAQHLTVRFRAEDPESGLDKCFWCSGTARYICDVAAYESIPIASSGVTRAVDQPDKLIGQRVFSSVRCSNRVGLWSVG